MVCPITNIRIRFALVLCRLSYTLMASDHYSHRPEFNGKTCHDIDSVFIESVPSKYACASLCRQNASCVGVFYNDGNKTCIGCSESVLESGESLKDDPGATYFQECEKIDDLDWIGFQSSKYKIFATGKTFDEGRAECRRYCSYLLHINSGEENIFLDSLARSTQDITHVLIGLTDREIEGQYKWSDDGTSHLIEDWGTDQPDGGSTENCMALSTFLSWKLADVDCDVMFPFICEK